MEVYNLLSSMAVRIPQEVTVQLAANARQYVAILETLDEMRKNVVLCDTCIVGSNGYSLYAHACVLAAVCPALRSQLASKHQANGTNIRISADSIENVMWERVLELIYRGEVQLPVCDLITFLDITRELDIQNVQVLYVPVKPMKKRRNLCFIATNNDDDPVHENQHGNDAYSSRSASNDDNSQDQVIIIDKDGVGFDSNSSKTDALVDMHSRVEALQCFERADGTPGCLTNLTSFADLSKDVDHNLQPPSVLSPLVDSVALDVKSEHDVDLDNRDTSDTFAPSSDNKLNKTQDGSCLLTCKTEPTDSQAGMSEWYNEDSTVCAAQEADALAQAFVSSGLMTSTDVFTRNSHLEAENQIPCYNTTSGDALTTPRSRKREKRFTCDLCRRSFGQMSDLHRHHRVHTGERPYSCNICGVRFTQSTSLRRHLRLLHGVSLSNQIIPRVDVCGIKS